MFKLSERAKTFSRPGIPQEQLKFHTSSLTDFRSSIRAVTARCSYLIQVLVERQISKILQKTSDNFSEHSSNYSFTIFEFGCGCDQCDQWCDQWHWRSQLVAPVSFLAPDFGRIITSSFKKKVNPHRKTIVDISSHQGFLLTRSDLRNICRGKKVFFPQLCHGYVLTL